MGFLTGTAVASPIDPGHPASVPTPNRTPTPATPVESVESPPLTRQCTDTVSASDAVMSACVEIGTRNQLSSAGSGHGPKLPDLHSSTLGDFPDWCEYDVFKAFRFQGCVGYSGVAYWYVSGRLDAIVYFTTTGLYELSASTGAWCGQYQLIPYDSEGFVSNINLYVSASCVGYCRVNSNAFPCPCPVTPLGGALGESYLATTITTPGAQVLTKNNWKLTFTRPGFAAVTLYDEGASSHRCDVAPTTSDSKVRGTGCVYEWSTPVRTLQLSSDKHSQLARHVQDAQQSGLPGAYGSGRPLTRLWSDAAARQNWDASCKRSYVKPPGESCDEYPFASSYEGASTGGFSDSNARSWAYCDLPFIPSRTGPGFSVCMTAATHNSSGGGIEASLFRTNRMLDHDKFYVWIQG